MVALHPSGVTQVLFAAYCTSDRPESRVLRRKLAQCYKPRYNALMTQHQFAHDQLLELLTAAWTHRSPRLRGSVPWAEVDKIARFHGCAPMIYGVLEQVGTSIPRDVHEMWQQSYYLTVTANAYHVQNLSQLLEALANLDTPILLLKGAALAEILYDNITQRPMGDADLVIPAHKLPACEGALLGLGFVPSAVELTPGMDVAYHNELSFSPREPFHIYVELHWHLLDIPYYLLKVPMDWFWENTETVEIAAHPVQVLTPEANLLYLPAHLALHHRFHGLRWFVDLAMLVHKYHETLDWDTVIGKAQEFELLLVLRETLDRLHGYWPSLPLEEPRQRLRALNPTPFEARLLRLLTTEPRSPLLDFYTDLVSLPNWPARMRFALLNLFPQQAYMAQRYGVKSALQLPYWYLYRLGDGAVKLGRTLPQVLRLR